MQKASPLSQEALAFRSSYQVRLNEEIILKKHLL